MKKKLSKNNGFTLVEMLIVVAIIAILVAVSIPLVSSSLENARERTDAANERAAKAEAAIIYLMGDKDVLKVDPGKGFEAVYDAPNGTLKKGSPKTGAEGSNDGYGQSTANKGMEIGVKVLDNGTIYTGWGYIPTESGTKPV